MIVTVLAVTTALFLATTVVAVHQKMKAEEARDEAQKEAGDASVRLQSAAQAVVPLTWAWDVVESSVAGETPSVQKLRHYLVNAFTSLQLALDRDDLAMTEAMESVPEPPRRLPRYPQVPPYLASPADVANVPPMPGSDR